MGTTTGTSESRSAMKQLGSLLPVLAAGILLAIALSVPQPAAAQGSNLCAGSGPSAAPNGILEPGEECDDGNLVNEDGCNNFCGLGTCVDDLTGVTNNCTANDVILGLLVHEGADQRAGAADRLRAAGVDDGVPAR